MTVYTGTNESSQILFTARDALFAIADKLLPIDHSISVAIEGAALDIEALLLPRSARRRCSCQRTIMGNAAWASHTRANPDHTFEGRV